MKRKHECRCCGLAVERESERGRADPARVPSSRFHGPCGPALLGSEKGRCLCMRPALPAPGLVELAAAERRGEACSDPTPSVLRSDTIRAAGSSSGGGVAPGRRSQPPTVIIISPRGHPDTASTHEGGEGPCRSVSSLARRIRHRPSRYRISKMENTMNLNRATVAKALNSASTATLEFRLDSCPKTPALCPKLCPRTVEARGGIRSIGTSTPARSPSRPRHLRASSSPSRQPGPRRRASLSLLSEFRPTAKLCPRTVEAGGDPQCYGDPRAGARLVRGRGRRRPLRGDPAQGPPPRRGATRPPPAAHPRRARAVPPPVPPSPSPLFVVVHPLIHRFPPALPPASSPARRTRRSSRKACGGFHDAAGGQAGSPGGGRAAKCPPPPPPGGPGGMARTRRPRSPPPREPGPRRAAGSSRFGPPPTAQPSVHSPGN